MWTVILFRFQLSNVIDKWREPPTELEWLLITISEWLCSWENGSVWLMLTITTVWQLLKISSFHGRFLLSEERRPDLDGAVHSSSSVFCKLTSWHKLVLSPPRGAKSEFVISGFDVDFGPWLLPNIRLVYRCFWICLFWCVGGLYTRTLNYYSASI